MYAAGCAPARRTRRSMPKEWRWDVMMEAMLLIATGMKTIALETYGKLH